MRGPLGLRGERWVQSSYKRNLDIALTVGISPLTIPLGLTALGLVRLLDGDDLIFKQTRYGRDGAAFLVRKITTMRESDDTDAHNSRKATTIGGALRPYAIDELPQFINVLQGTMSLVGPRAMPAGVRENMQAALDRNTYDEWLNAVETSRPGGLSSFGISIRSPEPTEISYAAKARMDIADFNDASLWHDFFLIKSAAAMAVRKLTYMPLPQETVETDEAPAFSGSLPTNT